MRRTVREITAELAASGLTPDQMALVTELAVATVTDASGGRSKHAEAQARYHARKKGGGDHLISSDHNDQPDTPPAYTTPPAKKPKRVSLHAEIPEAPPDDALAFADRAGWDRSRTALEWQRFRDWSLSKGRKHRDLLAAWRNWVRSPYQSPGGSNGSGPAGPKADKSVSGAADRILERLRDLDSPGEPH